MPINKEAYARISAELATAGVTLVAVSKTKPNEDIEALYELGQRDFGENYVQEMVEKAASLPGDIRWHFIGHLQSNKVKYIAPIVHLIHGVDSLKLLREIDKQAKKTGRRLDCLLQVHIAEEETKFGLDEAELVEALKELPALPHVRIRGLMGMASFTENQDKVQAEFKHLKSLLNNYAAMLGDGVPLILSMGMSADYRLAISEGSTLVRIGSLLFGAREMRG